MFSSFSKYPRRRPSVARRQAVDVTARQRMTKPLPMSGKSEPRGIFARIRRIEGALRLPTRTQRA